MPQCAAFVYVGTTVGRERVDETLHARCGNKERRREKDRGLEHSGRRIVSRSTKRSSHLRLSAFEGNDLSGAQKVRSPLVFSFRCSFFLFSFFEGGLRQSVGFHVGSHSLRFVLRLYAKNCTSLEIPPCKGFHYFNLYFCCVDL